MRQRFEDAGEAALLDWQLGKAPVQRVAGTGDWSGKVEGLHRTRYAGFTAKHFHAPWGRITMHLGTPWTKTFPHSRGLPEKAPRRGAQPQAAAGRLPA